MSQQKILFLTRIIYNRMYNEEQVNLTLKEYTINSYQMVSLFKENGCYIVRIQILYTVPIANGVHGMHREIETKFISWS